MEGKMENFDIKTIIAEALLEIDERPMSKRAGYIRDELWSLVWEKCVNLLNKIHGGCEHLALEQAICNLKRDGLLKDKVVYRKGTFYLKLIHSEYRIYKNGATGIVSACPWPAVKRLQILFPGNILGDLIRTFDDTVPEIESYIPVIQKKVLERELEEKKEMMEMALKENVVMTLIDQYLKPLGMTADYSYKDGDVVSMKVTQVLSTQFELPFDQLAEKLKDTSALQASLRVDEAGTEDLDSIFKGIRRKKSLGL